MDSHEADDGTMPSLPSIISPERTPECGSGSLRNMGWFPVGHVGTSKMFCRVLLDSLARNLKPNVSEKRP